MRWLELLKISIRRRLEGGDPVSPYRPKVKRHDPKTPSAFDDGTTLLVCSCGVAYRTAKRTDGSYREICLSCRDAWIEEAREERRVRFRVIEGAR